MHGVKRIVVFVMCCYSYGLLNISGDIEEPGGLEWQLVVSLLAAWVICYLCVIKGIQSSGKVSEVKGHRLPGKVSQGSAKCQKKSVGPLRLFFIFTRMTCKTKNLHI